MGIEACQVHKSDIKSLQIPSIHVDAMLCDPQPRGLKRKFPEEDDDNPPVTKNYNQKRHDILNLTYKKLQHFHEAPDSSLLRYVLLFNTMRSVEQEMERDGIKISCHSGGPFLPPVNCEESALDPLPPGPHAMGEGMPAPVSLPSSMCCAEIDLKPVFPSVIQAPVAASETPLSSAVNYGGDYADRCMVDVYNTQSGRVTPFVRTQSENAESGALWDESHRLTSLNVSSVLNFNSSAVASSCSSTETMRSTPARGQFDHIDGGSIGSSASDDATCSTETSLHTLMPPVTCGSSCISNLSLTYSSSSSNSPNTSPNSGNVSPASGSSPTSSEDEIFGDIDLTLYDFDLLSPLSPPNVRMAPVSAEELMRSLSDNANSAGTCSTVSYYKNEHFSDDREQVATSVRS